jgi:leucyl aminopeptidase
MLKEISHLDLWDISSKVNITKYPKQFHKGIKMRIEQQNYKFNSTKSILDAFRTLLNQPANIVNPKTFCNFIQDIFENIQNTTTIIKDTKQLEKEGLNLITSVDKTSSHMILIEYNGNKNNKEIDTVIVGKGVTFDAGGYSLKSKNAMNNMHLDKTGGIMALYLLYELAINKFKKNIVVCVPLVQNDISHIATKPGDIIKSYSGITVEITNTDAEGRLILADSLSYCIKNYKPKLIIDMGTLTGINQCNTSYSYYSLSDSIKKILEKSAMSYSEQLLELKLGKEYIKYTKSTRADIKNAEFGCDDASLAPLFLLNFIPKTYYNKWLHINLSDLSIKKDLAILEGSYSIMDFIKKIHTT